MSNISNLNLRSSLGKTNKSICQKSPRTLLDMAGGPKKKSLQWIQSYQDMQFWDSKWPNCPKQVFFEKTINIIFMYLLPTFIVQNLKAKLRVDQNYLPPTRFLLCTSCFHSLRKIFKRFLWAVPKLWASTISGSKKAYLPWNQFINLAPFTYFYLHLKS